MKFGIEIIYEDDRLLVLNKISGIPSAPLHSDESRTVVAAAVAHFPAMTQVKGHKPLEFGLLHRLDTGTSGLLVFAKTQFFSASLIGSFTAGKVANSIL